MIKNFSNWQENMATGYKAKQRGNEPTLFLNKINFRNNYAIVIVLSLYTSCMVFNNSIPSFIGF